MQTMNHVNILGSVGKEAEFFKNEHGTKAILLVATQSNGLIQWHVVAFYDKDADAIALLKSGDEIFIEGSLEYFKWFDCNGNERIAPEIAVNSFNIVKGERTQPMQLNQFQGEDQYLDGSIGYGNYHQTICDFDEEYNLDDKFDLEHYQSGGFANNKPF